MARPQIARLLDAQAPTATDAVPSALSLAIGNEHAVRSPALELQEALEEMLARSDKVAPEPKVALVLGLGLVTAAAACSAFWFALGRLVISLV